MDGRDETQREREPHPMLEVHDSRRGHIPGSEGARSKTRGIISHAGGARSMRGGGVGAGSHPRLETGCTIQSGAPHRGETPAQGAWPKQTPPPDGNGAWPGLPAAGVSREGGVASTEGAWRRTPLGGRGPLPLPAGGGARGGRCVWGGGGCAPLPAPRHGLLPPRPPAPPYRGEKPPSPPRSALECTYPKPWLLPGVVLRDGSERRERATKLAGTERSAGRAHSEAPAARADCGARQPISERGAFHSPGGAGGGGEWGRGGTNAWGGQGEPRSDRWAVGGEQGALGRHHFVAAGDDRGILGAAGSQPKGQDCRCVSGNRVF